MDTLCGNLRDYDQASHFPECLVQLKPKEGAWDKEKARRAIGFMTESWKCILEESAHPRERRYYGAQVLC